MPSPIIPIQEPLANRVAFNMPREEVGGKDGLILAIEQMLGGVAPARQSPVYMPFGPGGIPTAKSDPRAAQQGITALKPSQEMVDGAQMFVQRAMAETNSQDPAAVREWLGNYLKVQGLLD